MPDPSPSTLTVLNSNFLQLGRRSGGRPQRTVYPWRLPINGETHCVSRDRIIEPTIFRLLVRCAISCATENQGFFRVRSSRTFFLIYCIFSKIQRQLQFQDLFTIRIPTSVLCIGQWLRRHSPNSDTEPRHRHCTKYCIELVHNTGWNSGSIILQFNWYNPYRQNTTRCTDTKQVVRNSLMVTVAVSVRLSVYLPKEVWLVLLAY